MIVVVNANDIPIGTVSMADLKYVDQFTPVEQVMSRKLNTIYDSELHPCELTYQNAFNLMESKHIKALIVIRSDTSLAGILTKEDAVRLSQFTPSLDICKRLQVGVAVGFHRVEEKLLLIRELRVDCIVIDTAHGYQQPMLDAIKTARRIVGWSIPIVAGNVCTGEAAIALADAGADIIKVNIGPGAMCTTRMATGVGRPAFSAVKDCVDSLKGHFSSEFGCAREVASRRAPPSVWADGGVRHPRDIALYLAAGASRVMVGTWLSGTYESPGDIQIDSDGELYKSNYGMASQRAVIDRTRGEDNFTRAIKGFYREGISDSRIYLKQDNSTVGDVITSIIAGLRSALTYSGQDNIRDFQKSVVIGVQTSAGYKEGQASHQ